MAEAIFQKRIKHFNNKYNINKLDENFNISNTKETKIKISAIINESENNILLKIKFINEPFTLNEINIRQLPPEINKIIASYIPSYIEINTIIHYTHNLEQTQYPFRPPTWNLISVIDKSSSSINLQEYYQYIMNCHNHQYQLSWSPAIWIEHDILNFITRINHFEQIIH